MTEFTYRKRRRFPVAELSLVSTAAAAAAGRVFVE